MLTSFARRFNILVVLQRYLAGGVSQNSLDLSVLYSVLVDLGGGSARSPAPLDDYLQSDLDLCSVPWPETHSGKMSASVSGKMGATGRTVGSGVERSSAPGHGAALLRGWAGGAGAARGGSMDSVQGAEARRCATAGASGYKAALSAGAREDCWRLVRPRRVMAEI